MILLTRMCSMHLLIIHVRETRAVITGVMFVTFLEDGGDICFLPVVRNLASL